MSIKVRSTRGLTNTEYQDLQADVNMLGHSTVRIHREKYCFGCVDIRPRKRNGKWSWTEEEWRQVRGLVSKHNLTVTYSEHLDVEHAHSIFRQGVNYLRKEVAF